jgi:pimeloyl-ACP methyl ester carboxylesterase
MNPMTSFIRLLVVALLLAKTVPLRGAESVAPAKADPSSSSNSDESKVRPYTLPDMFQFADGDKVTSRKQWESRRAELLQIFQREMFGISPPKPTNLSFRVQDSDPQAMNGNATRKNIAISFEQSGEPFTFHLTLFVPNKKKGPAPVFLLLNHRGVENTDPTRAKHSDFWPAEEVIGRGYAIAAINVSAEVEPDQKNATNGVRRFYLQHSSEPQKYTWGALAAWAWSGSRAIDYFETDPEINAKQVAVIGHSRGGKTALWAAAEDTRIALVCVNGAGEGGPALSRRNFGETVQQITASFPYWFAPKYASYARKEESLPMDAHELVALVAPRGYQGGDAKLDTWADPRGSWLALVEASKVWALLGKGDIWKDPMPEVNQSIIQGPLGYHIRDGVHDLTLQDWNFYLDHADKLFREVSPKK